MKTHTSVSSNPVTVLQLIAPTHFGGAERVVLGLTESLNKDQFRVVVGAFVNIHFRQNEFVERLEKTGIRHEIFWLKRTVDLENIFRLVGFIKREGIHLIHSHGYRSDIIGLAAAKMKGLPIVSTLHGWVSIDSRLRFYEKCDRIALRFFDRVMPVSDHIGNALAASGIDPAKITRMHNAIPADTKAKEGPANITRSRKEKGDVIIGIIGRLSPEKDVPSFLKAAGLVAEKFNQAKFLVVGEGPERERLQQMAREMGLDGKVRFTGFVEDMGSIYSSIDLLVISSLTEGIPLVVLEAMQHGIPVVSTRVGGIPEVIENGVDGILVEPGDSHGLSQAIDSLILDDNKYVEISRNGRDRIARSFNRSAWIQEMEKIYHDVLR
jgi:glycosyltransferase involved in cell wall biosynthesis